MAVGGGARMALGEGASIDRLTCRTVHAEVEVPIGAVPSVFPMAV